MSTVLIIVLALVAIVIVYVAIETVVKAYKERKKDKERLADIEEQIVKYDANGRSKGNFYYGTDHGRSGGDRSSKVRVEPDYNGAGDVIAYSLVAGAVDDTPTTSHSHENNDFKGFGGDDGGGFGGGGASGSWDSTPSHDSGSSYDGGSSFDSGSSDSGSSSGD